MKKLFLVAWIALAIACNKNTEPYESPVIEAATPDTVTVSLAMTGEVTIEQTPWASKAAGEETESRDLYGILVYYDDDRSGKMDDLYGYGLFDNTEDMVISLLTGYQYRFICTLVKNGKDSIARRSVVYPNYNYMCHLDGYLNPFGYNYQGVEITNKFYLGNYSYYDNQLSATRLQSGTSYVRYRYYGNRYDWATENYPDTDRFYGEAVYTPQKGGVVNIEMKRCVFGVKYVITGVTDGTVGLSTAFGTSLSFKADGASEVETYTYQDVYGCWQGAVTPNDYSQDFTLNLSWNRGNGITQKLNPIVIPCKRNVITTVHIRLNGGDSDNSLNLDVEGTEMGNETIDFDIDAGDMTETPVEPTV